MNHFVNGFLKRANQHGLGDDVLHSLKEFFSHHPSNETLYSLADDAKSTKEEIGNFAKHIGGGALSGVGKGAIAGGSLGLLSSLGGSNPIKRTLAGAGHGAALGGLLEGGLTAYDVGSNTRDATVKPFEEELKYKGDSLPKEDLGRLKYNVQTMKNSPWFEYYFPPRVFEKLK